MLHLKREFCQSKRKTFSRLKDQGREEKIVKPFPLIFTVTATNHVTNIINAINPLLSSIFFSFS